MLLVLCAAPTPVAATCGDYLQIMPKDDSPTLPHEPAEQDQSKPCHGPHCSQGKFPTSPAMPSAVKSLSPVPDIYAQLEDGCPALKEQRQVGDRPVRARHIFANSIFHPPRAS